MGENAIMFKAMLILAIMVWCADACSEVSLVVPVATAHIEYSDAGYNNTNHGLGVEYLHDNKRIIGALYLNKDSYNNENLYFYYGRKFQFEKDIDVSLSGFFATSYDAGSFSPLISFTYSYLRIVTTYPFGKLANQEADMINAQLVIPIKF